MKVRIALLVLAAAAVFGAGVAWWLHTYKRVEQSVDLPRTGEAATNPLHALRLALEADGRHVRSWRRLDPAVMRPAPGDTILYDGDLREVPAAVRPRLLDWLFRGGHLIAAAPPADVAFDAFAATRAPRDRAHVRVLLLEDVDVHVRRGTGGCIDAVGRIPTGLCRTRRFDPPAGTRQRLGDADGDVYARVHVPGGGLVDVAGSLDFLTTDALREGVNAEFAHQLFAVRRGTVHLVHDAALPSLWWTLLRHGWPVWLPLLLLTAGALWARMRRFGPLLPSTVAGRRSLLEHVAASGEHHWRYGRADRLHAAMLEAFQARLRRRDPQAAALQGEVQRRRLAERTGVPEARIAEALRTPDARDAQALVARIATLVRMRNRL